MDFLAVDTLINNNYLQYTEDKETIFIVKITKK